MATSTGAAHEASVRCGVWAGREHWTNIKVGREKRNGPGVQQWSDGSKYEGEFVNDLKHGTGVFTWTNGEFYDGSFYKDYRHGNGTYSWPAGFKFVGKFYLNRKEGYGIQTFPDGTTFQGLYHADERFGPGVVTYPDGRQDVGLWHRERLLRLCTALEGGFTLHAFPEHMARINCKKEPKTQSQSSAKGPETKAKPGTRKVGMDPLLSPYHELLQDERFILPPDMDRYSTDSDHLPVPWGLRKELDLQFFGEHCDNPDTNPDVSAALPLQQRMQAHIHRHRFEVEALDWDVEAVLSENRERFGPKGSLELNSEGLIQEASLGDPQSVYRILRDGKIHPDVGDARGHTALIAATVNCHNDVIHLLLDSGADVNNLNCEGMSALAVCNVLYYPIQSLHETVAEKVPQKTHPKSQAVKARSPSVNSPQSSIVEATKNRAQTTKQADQPNQADDTAPKDHTNQADNEATDPAQCNDSQVSLYNGQGYCQEEADQDEDEQYLQDCSDQAALDLDRMDMTAVRERCSIQVLDGNIPLGSVPWHEKGGSDGLTQQQEEGEAGSEEDRRRERRGSLMVDPAFDSTRSLASFHIHVTEEVMQKTAEALSRSGLVPPADTQETVRKMALMKTEHRGRWTTIKLLLDRGADPNASSVPMPVLFLAIKAGHIQAVRRLLECGARTDMCLPSEQKGFYPLHIAAALPGAEGPKITELLLHAVADPDVTAQDAYEVFKLDKVSRNPVEPQAGFGNKTSTSSGPPSQFYMAPSVPPEEGGRTPLHMACQRDKDYTNAREVVSLLLSHKASTNLLWSGHSPLSLAIASGNDLAVDELLAGGADPNLPLTRRVGSALCAMTNISYDCAAHLRNRTKLLEKLMKAGANILMPVVVGEGRRCAVGTAVDYAHYAFHQDWRIAHTPYHALNQREREAYNARRQILSVMGDLLRQAAIRMERQRGEREQGLGISSVSPTEKFVYTGAGSTPPWNKAARAVLPEEQDSTESLPQQIEQQQRAEKRRGSKAVIVRKPLFKYCYQCGRSVGVVLIACSRCHEVFYCSKTCKMKAWNDRHKDECVRVPAKPKDPNNSVRKAKSNEGSQDPAAQRRYLGAGAKTKMGQLNLAQKLSESQYENLKENYSFI
ncbi:ankyrin repeat and MYND domain-containing protein 1 isoform X4 [Coregonus clupeaformis]|uniref:ankyrin repeat and MYND domain-containing protein 1 isoform X4 n=1 Tax=Coregonus clupeaformis TaxID=59861 RepID=UPI001BDFC587|nr:ankyrin repeat and MYND domain-containing protein 1 isoform X4 [Coregonus clupeaformis]